MSHVFVSGATDGLGLAAARMLIEQGHQVTGHARNAARATDLRATLPTIDDVLIGEPARWERACSRYPVSAGVSHFRVCGSCGVLTRPAA